MKTSGAVFVILGLALALGSSAASSADSVSNHLADCQAGGVTCRERVTDVVVNGRDTHYICIPKGVHTTEAVQQEIQWLEKSAREKPSFSRMDMEDALWNGAHHLWPCRHG